EFGNRDVDSTAVYGTYRSAGDMYLLGKIGVASLDGFGESDTGLSFGLGAGIATGSGIAIEAEYTVLDSDVSFFVLTGKINFYPRVSAPGCADNTPNVKNRYCDTGTPRIIPQIPKKW